MVLCARIGAFEPNHINWTIIFQFVPDQTKAGIAIYVRRAEPIQAVTLPGLRQLRDLFWSSGSLEIASGPALRLDCRNGCGSGLCFSPQSSMFTPRKRKEFLWPMPNAPAALLD